MKAAHQGVPAAGLPLGVWRSGGPPIPFPLSLPPLDLTGAPGPTPPPGGRGGGSPASAPLAAGPPAPTLASPVPGGRASPTPVVNDAPRAARADSQRRPAGERTNSFLDKIFGRL